MGTVYILTNEAMPGLIKIGLTNGDELTVRMKQLYSVGVPLPFECFYAARVADAAWVERRLHTAFAPHRLNENREFFSLDPVSAAAALELAALENVTPNQTPVETPQDQAALDKATKKAGRFNFEMVKIPIGAMLQFAGDPAITAKVVSKSKINFEGEETSLSAAALKVLQKQGKTWPTAQGPNHWMYEGKTLLKRREDMEEEED